MANDIRYTLQLLNWATVEDDLHYTSILKRLTKTISYLSDVYTTPQHMVGKSTQACTG